MQRSNSAIILSMKKLTVKNSDQKISLGDISALRVAFFVASLMIIVGAVGSHYVHEYFHVLPFLVAFGLMFSSISGWCPMASVVEKLFIKRN